MAKRSKFGTINWRDAAHGLLIAVAGAILAFVQQTIGFSGDSIMPTVNFEAINIKSIGSVALISAVAYIGKQINSNSDGKLWKKEQKKADTDNP